MDTPSKPYLLKSEVARRYGIRPRDVERVFPVTVIAGRKRFLVDNLLATERRQTFAPKTANRSRKVPTVTFQQLAALQRAQTQTP